MARRFLGTVSGLSHRTRFYLAPDAIEIDEIEGYSGTRKRVLLDEVLLVTFDRRRNRTLILGLAGVAFLLAVIALVANAGSDPAATWLVAGIMTSPFLAIIGLHAALGTDYVTVFGKRSTAQLAFRIRKRRARAVFLELRERIAASHQQARARLEPAADLAAPAGSTTAA